MPGVLDRIELALDAETLEEARDRVRREIEAERQLRRNAQSESARKRWQRIHSRVLDARDRVLTNRPNIPTSHLASAVYERLKGSRDRTSLPTIRGHLRAAEKIESLLVNCPSDQKEGA